MGRELCGVGKSPVGAPSAELRKVSPDYPITPPITVPDYAIYEHPYWTNYRREPTGTWLVRVEAGETYRFTACVKAEGATVRSTIKVGFLDDSKTHLRGKSAVLTGPHDWRRLALTCKAPPMAVRLTLGLASSGGASTSWFDDFELARLD